MEFQPEDYGPDIARILNLAGGGRRLMPLVKTPSTETLPHIDSLPDSVLSGLYLCHGCWDAAHSAADRIEDPTGYFWHAIVHRQEPDPANSTYWFRKTGKHPIFPKLAAEASNIGYHGARDWDPYAFVDFCETAGQRPGSTEERIAMQVQLVEWQLLFDYSARGLTC